MRELPNSIKICYPVFRDHIPVREALLAHSAEIFTLIETGQLKVSIGKRYPLADAAQAHLDIEFRATTGKPLLLLGLELARRLHGHVDQQITAAVRDTLARINPMITTNFHS